VPLFTQQLIKYNTSIFTKNFVSYLPLIDDLWISMWKNFEMLGREQKSLGFAAKD
jgi:hypothetical protein